jgi:hypothetical protein
LLAVEFGVRNLPGTNRIKVSFDRPSDLEACSASRVHRRYNALYQHVLPGAPEKGSRALCESLRSRPIVIKKTVISSGCT